MANINNFTILVFWQFLVALCMGLSALSFFIWAALSGMFHNVEDVKYTAYHAEIKAGEEVREED